MEQSTHKAINWLSHGQLTEILEDYGFCCSITESEDDLREAVRENISDGTIPDYEVFRP